MNRQELEKKLLEEGFSPDMFSLDGSWPDEDAYVLMKIKGRWFLEYIERGTRRILGDYDDEESACASMLTVMQEHSPEKA